MIPYPKEIRQAVLNGLDLSVIFYHHHEKNLDDAKMFSIVDQKGSIHICPGGVHVQIFIFG